MVQKVHAYRKELGTEMKPFEMVSVAIDAFDRDGPRPLEDMGIDEACLMPWLSQVGKLDSPLQFNVDAIRRFGDEIICKM